VIALITLAPTGTDADTPLNVGVRPMPTCYELAFGRSGDLTQVAVRIHTVEQAEQLLTAAQSIVNGLKSRRNLTHNRTIKP